MAHGGRTRDEHHRLGRAAAAAALAAAGTTTATVSGPPGGPPVWPTGVSGSISHADGVAVAVVTVVTVSSPTAAPTVAHGVGIDLERLGRLPDADAAFVLAPAERVDADGHVVDATVPWAVKEATFKAISGATPGGLASLEPSVIEVRLAPGGTAAVVVGNAAGTVNVMGAHWCVVDGFVLAVVAVTRVGPVP